MALDKFGVKGSKGTKKADKEQPPKKSSKKSSGKKSSTKAASEIVDDFDLHNAGATKGSTIDEEIEEPDDESEPKSETSSLISSKKKNLKCTNGKCGFKRMLFKKELTEEDYICGKCGGIMKLLK